MFGIGGVAHLVELGDMLADIIGVKEDGLLANVAGMMNQMDDLFSRLSKLYSVLGQSKFVLVSDVLPQS